MFNEEELEGGADGAAAAPQVGDADPFSGVLKMTDELLAAQDTFLLNYDDATDSESEEGADGVDGSLLPGYRAKPHLKGARDSDGLRGVDAAWEEIEVDGGVEDLLLKLKELKKKKKTQSKKSNEVAKVELTREQIRLAFILQDAGVTLYHSDKVTGEYKREKKQTLGMPVDYSETVSPPILDWLMASITEVLDALPFVDADKQTVKEQKTVYAPQVLEVLVKNIRHLFKLVNTMEDSATVRFFCSLDVDSDALFAGSPPPIRKVGGGPFHKDKQEAMGESLSKGEFANTLKALMRIKPRIKNKNAVTTAKQDIVANLTDLVRALVQDISDESSINSFASGNVLGVGGVYHPDCVVKVIDCGYSCTIGTYCLTVMYINDDEDPKDVKIKWMKGHRGSEKNYILVCHKNFWKFGGYSSSGKIVDGSCMSQDRREALTLKLQSGNYSKEKIDSERLSELFRFIIERIRGGCSRKEYLQMYIDCNRIKIFQEFLVLTLRKHIGKLSMHRPAPDELTLSCKNARDVIVMMRYTNRCMMRMGANKRSHIMGGPVVIDGKKTVGVLDVVWEFGSVGSTSALEYLRGAGGGESSQMAFNLYLLTREFEVLSVGSYESIKTDILIGHPKKKEGDPMKDPMLDVVGGLDGVSNDVALAMMVRFFMKCEKPTGVLKGPYDKLKPEEKKWIAGFALLFCYLEGMRNPAILIVNQMLLDLIIDGKVLWRDVFADGKYPMPTVFEKITSTSRKKNRFFGRYMPHMWEYPGAADAVHSVPKLLFDESRIFSLWCEHNKLKSSEMKCSELCGEIVKAQTRWFSGFSE